LALEEADHLKTLLNEILQYAREQTLEVIDIDLVALVRKLPGGDRRSSLGSGTSPQAKIRAARSLD